MLQDNAKNNAKNCESRFPPLVYYTTCKHSFFFSLPSHSNTHTLSLSLSVLSIFAIGEKNIVPGDAGLGETDKRQTELKPTAIGAIGGAAGETGN